MNFQQLRFVIAVADTGSFTKAADLCCVTQPALSNAVNQLEDELGGRLFERTTRAVTTTKFGNLLIDEMREIVEARVTLLTHAADYLARDDKNVRIGLSPLISSDFVKSLLARLEKTDALLNIVLTEMNKADIAPALQSGAIDFGLCPAPVPGDAYCSMSIYSEPLLFVSDEKNETPVLPISLVDLAEQKILLVQDGCGLSDTVRILLHNNQLQLEEYEGRALGYHVLEKWARMGIGITLLPASQVSEISFARPIENSAGVRASISFMACWNKLQEERPSFKSVAACLSPQVY